MITSSVSFSGDVHSCHLELLPLFSREGLLCVASCATIGVWIGRNHARLWCHSRWQRYGSHAQRCNVGLESEGG